MLYALPQYKNQHFRKLERAMVVSFTYLSKIFRSEFLKVSIVAFSRLTCTLIALFSYWIEAHSIHPHLRL
jgi:hypothetical protein